MLPTTFLFTSADRLQSAGWRGLRLGWHVRILEDIPPGDQRYMAVFDVDLSNIETTYAARKCIEQGAPLKTVFLIDPARRIERVNADVLGADAILDRASTDAEIVATLGRLLFTEQAPDPAQQRVEESVNRVAEGMGGAFDNYLRGKALDKKALNKTITATLGGIEDNFSSWMSSVRNHHEGTFQHCMLVMGFAAGIGVSLGMRQADCKALTTAALLHDIGKMDVPFEILEKPGKLTPEERAVIMRHPVAGYQYLSRKSDLSADILHAVLHHHEFLDGTGYPKGLSGSDIPDMTRILTICDVAAALSERRSYKPPMSSQMVMQTLREMADAGKLDPDIVRAFAASLPAIAEPGQDSVKSA